MTTLYEKRGRRYHAVSEYDPLVMDSMPAGAHLVVVEPGVRSTRYQVKPEHAPLLAALHAHRGELIEILREASRQRPRRIITRRERRAWAAYCAVMGRDVTLWVELPSANEVIDALEAKLIAAVAG